MPQPTCPPSIVQNAAKLGEALSHRQYLRPHRSLVAVLADLEICPAAVEQAMRWLKLDDSRPIGRLRATELQSLSRCIHRLIESTQPQPAEPQLV